MNKTISAALFGLLLLAGASTAIAKKGGGARPAFDQGDNTLGFAVGLGNTYSYYGGTSYFPAFYVIYDHGIVGNVGPGTIGLGGVIGWQGARYNYNNGRTDTWTNLIFGVRGTYHLTILKDKNNKFDPYGGVTVGIRSEHYSNDYNGPSVSEAHPFVGPFIGAKYNFTPNFGAFSEVGYDISFLKLGLHFNF